jgi:hypothetical protein
LVTAARSRGSGFEKRAVEMLPIEILTGRGGVTAGSTVIESPDWGVTLYANNTYAGPSFTVGKS